MNSNQSGNLVTTLVQLALGSLATRGLITGSEVESLSGIILAIITFILSHNWHATSANPPSSTPPSGKLPALILVGAMAGALFLSGCTTNAPTGIYKGVGTTDAAVTAAVKAWDIYVTQNTVPISQQIAVKNAFLKVQAAEKLVLDGDAVYAAYGTTNAPAGVLATLATDQTAFTDALTDLTGLLSQFNIKL